MSNSWQALGLLSAALIVAPGAAANPTVTVSDQRCGTVVALEARNVLLSRVLDELAEALSFQVTVAAEADRTVTASLSGPARDVITALTRHDNVIYIERSDPGCADQRRPIRITVLEGRAGAPSELVVENVQAGPDPELTMVPPRMMRLTRMRDDGKDEPPRGNRRRNRQ